MERVDRLRKYEIASRKSLKEMSIRMDTKLADISIGGIGVDWGKEGWPQFVDIRINGEGTYYIYVLRYIAENILNRAKEIKWKLDNEFKLHAGGSIQYIFGLY
jgi:hypothetical protein